jgi:hypothetical protein
MKILFESDRECTIDGVGLLEPGSPVEVDPVTFQSAHGYLPTKALLPYFVSVLVDMDDEGGE